MELLWDLDSDSVAAFLSLITYGAVVYATFKLKTEQRRQAIVSLAVCTFNIVPPLIALKYNNLSIWMRFVNICCFCAYAINLGREIWVHRSFNFFKGMVWVIFCEILITALYFNGLGLVQYRAQYCAIFSLLAAAAPAFGCLIFRWTFSYMDTYFTMIGAVATILQFLPLMEDDSTQVTAMILCLTSSIGAAYSLYAYYSVHVADIPDCSSYGRSKSERG